jgi:hypothetical protein
MQCPFHKSPESPKSPKSPEGQQPERYSPNIKGFIKCLNDFGFIYGDLPEGISDIDNFVGFIKDGLIANGILSSQAEVRAIIIRDAFLSGQIINAYFLHNYPDLQIHILDIETFYDKFISDQNLRLILEHLLMLKRKIYSTVTSINLKGTIYSTVAPINLKGKIYSTVTASNLHNYLEIVYKVIQSEPSYTKLVEIIKRLTSGSTSASDLLTTINETVRDEIFSALKFQLTIVPDSTLSDAYRSRRLMLDSLGYLQYVFDDKHRRLPAQFPPRIDIGGGVKLTGRVSDAIGQNRYNVVLTGSCPIRVWFRI